MASESERSRAVEEPRLAVALSGGGFRAALFHAGVLLRIAEAGWLLRLDVLSTVSGGSILGAYFAVRARKILEDGGSAASLRRHMIEPFTDRISSASFIAEWAKRLPLILTRKLGSGYTRTNLAAELYERWFKLGSMAALPAAPYLILNASNLLSARAWRFTRDGCGDSRFGYASWRSPFSLAEAVAASAAFPPVFPPLAFGTADRCFSGPVYNEEPLTLPPYLPLSDGGVYDNLGLEVLTKPTHITGRTLQRPEFLLASDGGYPPQARFRRSGMPAIGEGLLLFRVSELARDQVGALRRRMLVNQFQTATPSGALIVLGSRVEKLPGPALERYVEEVGADALIPDAILKRLHRMRTHLDAFSPAEAEVLMYHGYTLTDAVLGAYSHTYTAAYQWTTRGTWRVRFTPSTIEQWMAALDRQPTSTA